MIKPTILALFLILASLSFGQTLFFSDDFETPSSNWSTSGVITSNVWVADQCAGNGNTTPGTSSMYITDGSAGCGITGNEQYAYMNSGGLTESVINYTSISAGCLTSLEMYFDYKIDGSISNSTGEVVYSIDNGTNWIAIGGNLANSGNWTNSTLTLPAVLESTTFWIGFRFTYDNSAINGIPLAIDNVSLSGSDNTPPTILCPAVIPLYVTTSCDAAIIDYTLLASAADNCLGAVAVTQLPAPASIINITGSPTITLTATDEAGNQNTCQFTQTIFDTISPTISCPGTQTVNMNASCEATVGDYIAMAISSDNCESFANVTITQAPPLNSIIGADATITLTAEDGYGNTKSCDFTLQTIDAIAPTITCPGPITKSTDSGCEYVLEDFTAAAVVNDNCTPLGTLVLSQSPLSGTNLSVGINQITLYVEDLNGNSSSCFFDITVEDQVNPIISACPPNQDVIVDANCSGLISDYTSLVVTTDNCSAIANLQITQTPISGTSISANTLVDILVIDESGNSETCQFTALLLDDISPIVNCPSDFSIAIDGNCEYTIPDISGTVSGTDNCSSFANMTITQNPIPGSTGNGTTNVLITLFDEQNNLNTCITQITPIDNIAPTITCPSPPQVNNGTDCDYTLPNFGSATIVLDNCSDYSIVQSPAIGTIVNPGITEVTITVTDAGNNEVECSFNLSVIETEAPIITCPGNISTCDPIVTFDAPIYSDNCFSYIYQTDFTGLSSGDSFPIGITNIEYTVADSSSNEQSCTFQIEVLDFPSAANILNDTLELCNQTSTLLEADPITTGTGLWTLLSGQGNFNNQFANTTGVNNLAFGENVFIWTVSSASCGSNSDTLVVVSSQTPISASIPFDTIFPCAIQTIDLLANDPLNGAGNWTTTSTAQILNAQSNVTTATISSSGISQFIWTVSNGACPITRDTMYVVSNLSPTINSADTAICIEDNFLSISGGNAVTGQNLFWSSDDSGVIIETPASPITNVDNFSIGENVLIYTSEFDGCPSTQNSISVVSSLCDSFEPVFPTIITPNFDGKNDLFVIDYLEKIYPECHVTIFNRWGNIVFESIGYEQAWDGTRKGEPLPMGTYFYKIELNDESNTVFNGDISIIH